MPQASSATRSPAPSTGMPEPSFDPVDAGAGAGCGSGRASRRPASRARWRPASRARSPAGPRRCRPARRARWRAAARPSRSAPAWTPGPAPARSPASGVAACSGSACGFGVGAARRAPLAVTRSAPAVPGSAGVGPRGRDGGGGVYVCSGGRVGRRGRRVRRLRRRRPRSGVGRGGGRGVRLRRGPCGDGQCHQARQGHRDEGCSTPHDSYASGRLGMLHVGRDDIGTCDGCRPFGEVCTHARAPHEHRPDVRWTSMTTTQMTPLAARVERLPWDELEAQLDASGFAITEPVFDADECAALADLFDSGRFRSTIDMARHRFGQGTYRYFDRPLPAEVGELRESLYARLAPVANRWAELLGEEDRFPETHGALLDRCAEAGQRRPTPLILRYGPGRLERPPPGPLRRRVLPLPGRDRARRAGRGLRGRRVRAHGAAPAGAEPRPRPHAAAGRLRPLPDAPAAAARRPRALPGRAAARRQHRDPAGGGRRSASCSTTRRERRDPGRAEQVG